MFCMEREALLPCRIPLFRERAADLEAFLELEREGEEEREREREREERERENCPNEPSELS